MLGNVISLITVYHYIEMYASVIETKLNHNIDKGYKKSLRYQRGNQNPYIEEEQIKQWSKEKG